MTKQPVLFIVVPVYNERDNVLRLVDSFGSVVREFEPTFSVRFIVVDDGSHDGTAQSFERHRGSLAIAILRHTVNLGPGKAFATAFGSLSGEVRDIDYVTTIEGDNTSRLELIRQMITRLAEGFDVVLASPYLYGGGIRQTNTYRIILSNIANILVKEALGLRGIMTMSSFFRVYRGAAFCRLQEAFGVHIIERAGFESMVEMLFKMVFLGFRISEVAMVLDTSLRAGKSKMNVMRTAIGYLTLWKDKRRWMRLADLNRKSHTLEELAEA